LDYEPVAYQIAGANRHWRWPFRCRGSRRESAVAQLSTLVKGSGLTSGGQWRTQLTAAKNQARQALLDAPDSAAFFARQHLPTCAIRTVTFSYSAFRTFRKARFYRVFYDGIIVAWHDAQSYCHD
jgi:hypothetical protein